VILDKKKISTKYQSRFIILLLIST